MSADGSVQLWSKDGLHVQARLDAHGQLVISGQDLRAEQVFGPGAGEYEYGLTVTAADVPTVVAGLGGRPGDDVLVLLGAHGDDLVAAGEMSWLRTLGVEPKFWSHIGG